MIEYLPPLTLLALFLFFLGVPIPIGRKKRVAWCGTGRHIHVYKKGGDTS